MLQLIRLICCALLLSGCTAMLPPATVTTQATAVNEPQIKHAALLLPLSGNLAQAGLAVKEGFLAAYYASDPKPPLTIDFYDTASQTEVTKLYQQAIDKGADFVIGPLTKSEVQALKSGLSQMPVTTLALNYTELSFFALPKNLYQFGLSPLDEAQQIANNSKLNPNRALLITPQNPWGESIAQTLQQVWTARGGKLVAHLTYNAHQDIATQIKATLLIRNNDKQSAQQRRNDIDVIFLAATPDIARQIQPLLKFYHAGNIPIYALSSIYNGTPNPASDRDLDGIIFCDTPWTIVNSYTQSKIYQQLASLSPDNFQRVTRLYALGIDSYHLMWSLVGDNVASGFHYSGATGDLTIYRRQVQRHLPWAQFNNGVPILLNSA